MKNQKINWGSIAVYIVFNFLALLGVSSLLHKFDTKKPVEVIIERSEPVHHRNSIFEYRDFNEKAFYDYILEVNIKFPKIVYAQALLESGNFTSSLFTNHNNPFGMQVAKQRPTLSTNSEGYASYKYWQSSVIDYALFQSRFMKAYDTEEKYLARLGEVYAEDPSYVFKLKKLVETLNKP